MKNQGLRYCERGSAVVWVFILIALFGILTVAMSKGSRNSLGSLDKEQSDLTASEILTYAQAVREATRSVRIAGCSDTQINFIAPATGATYDNTNAPTDGSCDVFRGAGGVSYSVPEDKWIDVTKSSNAHYGQWFFTGDTHIYGIGVDAVGGTCDADTQCKELIMGLPYINLNVCKAINKRLGFGDSDGTPIKDGLGSYAAPSATPFTGTYFDTGGWAMGNGTPSSYSGTMAGCIEGDTEPLAGTYHFFQVLLVR